MGYSHYTYNKKVYNKLTGKWVGIDRIKKRLTKGDYIFYKDGYDITIERVLKESEDGIITLYNKYGEWEITRDEVIAVKMRGWL